MISNFLAIYTKYWPIFSIVQYKKYSIRVDEKFVFCEEIHLAIQN